MLEYDSYRVLAGKIRMYVRDWPGEKGPLLFVHGFAGNSLGALQLGKLLFEERRVIAPDLRGRGNSDMPFGDYGIDTHLKDLIACLDRLEVEQVIAAGHSFGATLCMFLAARYPQRVNGLILFDGGPMPSPAARDTLEHEYASLQYRYASVEDYVNRYKASPLYQPWTEELDALVRSNLYQEPDGSYIRRAPRFIVNADRLAQQLETMNQLPALYPEIRCPALVIRAGQGLSGPGDQVLTDEVITALCAAMPAVQVVTIAEAGHTSLLTLPSPTRDQAILHFLDRLP